MIEPTEKRRPLRLLLRSLHRDVGYLVVGLTVVYAISGIAVNHLGDWDPNFDAGKRERQIGVLDLESSEDVVFAHLQERLGHAPEDLFVAGDEARFFIEGNEATYYLSSGLVTEDFARSRLTRPLVWLHTARNKPAWKYIADVYALLLLSLAVSGLFLNKGKQGLAGRGKWLVAVGVLIPVLYVILSKGPGATRGDDEVQIRTD